MRCGEKKKKKLGIMNLTYRVTQKPKMAIAVHLSQTGHARQASSELLVNELKVPYILVLLFYQPSWLEYSFRKRKGIGGVSITI